MSRPGGLLSRPAGSRGRRTSAAPGRHIDFVLIAATFALVAFGLVMVFSATRGSGGTEAVDTSFLVRQGAFCTVGFAAMACLALVDYRRLRAWAPVLYVISLLLLVLVVSPVGVESKGVQAWFQVGSFQFQPSEPAKLALVLAISTYLCRFGGNLSARHLGVTFVIGGIPAALILTQPDLGTVLVFVAITVAVALVGGARGLHLLIVGVLAIGAFVAIVNSDVLAEYQQERLTGFLDPEADLAGSTYNQQNSLIAVGAGGLFGQGLFEGSQNRTGAVPEQQTDFIFTVVGEELGFAGSLAVLGLYGLLIWRIWRAASASRDLFGVLVCVGVLAMIVFQVFQSIGMAAGIMPVTGIPLPLLSYGGSSTVTTLAALGVVLSVHMRRYAA